MIVYQQLDTPDGPFTMVERDGAVVASGWTADAVALAARAHIGAAELELGDCAAAPAVLAWYAGDAAALDGVRVEQAGTDFQMAVWAALRAIPRGTVRRYGELAAALGSPGASRAVGAACGRNAVALFVPCHRVVGASGALTGFAWGVDVKRSLLAREGVVG
jgi:methylated-DNA-[protein]-cysteine S-methyltransferase